MSETLCQRVGAICDDLLTAEDLGPARAAIVELRASLREPLRVAVAGRVNAGKSTLVNALLRQRVAPTDVSECTRLVTWYRFGVPERVEIVAKDGRVEPTPLRPDGTLPASLDMLVDDVSHLVVYLSSDALRDMVIIDTPGLSSLTDDRSQATRELLALDRSSRDAAAKADALVLVMTSALHRDEAEVVEGFRNEFAGLAPSALNAVGVLNKADQLGGEGNPRLAAAALARSYAETMRDSVAAVVPLVGLLAESADCGLLTERDVVLFRELAALPDADRRALMLSVDRFVSAEVPVDPEERLRLLERLDTYGIERSFEWIAAGHSSAGALTNELRAIAGIEALRRVLDETFARNADALKAAGVLASLERLAFEHAGTGWSAWIRDRIEDVRIDPAMHRLAEIRAVQEWAGGAIVLPTDLARGLHRLLTATTPAARLGLADDVTPDDVAAAAAAAAAAWRSFGNDARATPPQRWLAEVACRSCELVWVDARQGAGRSGT